MTAAFPIFPVLGPELSVPDLEVAAPFPVPGVAAPFPVPGVAAPFPVPGVVAPFPILSDPAVPDSPIAGETISSITFLSSEGFISPSLGMFHQH